MVHEGALLESQTLRAAVAERTEALEKVKALTLLSDGLHVTTRMVADYFEVAERTVNRLMQRHREELTENGMRTLRGSELELFKRDILSPFPESYPQPRSNLALFTRRTVLNVAMLLRDSDVARRVRTYLLDAEHRDRATHGAPAPPPPHPREPAAHKDEFFLHGLLSWLDERIARRVAQEREERKEQERRRPDGSRPADDPHVRQVAEETVRDVVGRTVVPLLNGAIDSQRELRRRLSEHETEMIQLRRVLREQEASGSMGALDAMNGREFERHVAWLCRRDGCDQVTVTGGHGDAGADIIGYTADGRRLIVQCKARTPSSSITSADVQGFIGMARLEYKADVALLVATAPFTRDALLMAARHEVTAVHRGLLEAWNHGSKLRALG
ncbi:restriction endonuclease [Streptomyces marispadix]|uniref:Restriction endonuclease n=1 Tax=Streptomyces marispadix TaxID=2922868 RepID=A0ABS9SZN1_9ACTN|nr:restriction endonuclease [Streptomyces marispadix]MCH6161496.1 restriction endonuclease [Streptomyces marispadix]